MAIKGIQQKLKNHIYKESYIILKQIQGSTTNVQWELEQTTMNCYEYGHIKAYYIKISLLYLSRVSSNQKQSNGYECS